MSKLSSPLALTDEIDLAHHAEILRGAFSEGVDLGSRSTHIRALAVSLKNSLEILKDNVLELESSPDAQVPIVASIIIQWRFVIQKLQRAIDLADQYKPS